MYYVLNCTIKVSFYDFAIELEEKHLNEWTTVNYLILALSVTNYSNIEIYYYMSDECHNKFKWKEK